MRHTPPRIRKRVLDLAVAAALGLAAPLAGAVDVVWIGGVGNWTGLGGWSSGLGRPSSGDTVFVDNGASFNSVVNVSGVLKNWADRLVISSGDAVNLVDGARLQVFSSVDNNGRITLSAAGTPTVLQLGTDGVRGSATVHLTGTGLIDLGSSGQGQLLSPGPTGSSFFSTLVQHEGHTVQGAGQLGMDQLGLENHGLILANQAQPLVLDLYNGNPLHDVTRANRGQMVADAGVLRIVDTVLDNGGGIISARNGGEVRLNASTIAGGTVSSDGSSVIWLENNAVLSNLSLGGRIAIDNGEHAELKGSIVNQGEILVNKGVQLVTRADTWLDGSGVLTLRSSHNGLQTSELEVQDTLSGLPTTLTQGVSHTLQGAGLVRLAGTNRFVNRGTVLANAPTSDGALIIGGDVSGGAGTGTVTNLGVFQANAGSTLVVASALSNYDANSKTLTGGSYRVQGTAAQPGVMRLSTGDIVHNAADIRLDGPNSQLLRNDTGADALAHLATNAGRFSISNGRDFSVAGPFTDSGELIVGANSTFASQAGVVQTGGSISVDGVLAANVAMSGGRLSGTSVIIGNLLNDGGVVAPGHSPGTLSVNGNYTQTSGGRLELDLAGGGSFDVLSIGGLATLGGTLDIFVADGFMPDNGQHFSLMYWGGRVPGSVFDAVHFHGGSPTSFELSYDATGLTVTYSAAPVPEPGSWALMVAGLGLLVGWRKRAGLVPSPSGRGLG